MNTELDKLIGLLEKGRRTECKPCQKRLQAAGVATAAKTLAELAALGLLAGTALILSQSGRDDLAQLVRNWSPVSTTEISEEDRAQIQWASTWAQQDAARGVVNDWQTQVEGIGWNPVGDMDSIVIRLAQEFDPWAHGVAPGTERLPDEEGYLDEYEHDRPWATGHVVMTTEALVGMWRGLTKDVIAKAKGPNPCKELETIAQEWEAAMGYTDSFEMSGVYRRAALMARRLVAIFCGGGNWSGPPVIA